MIRQPSNLNPSIAGKFSFGNDKGKSQIYDCECGVWLSILRRKVAGGGLGLARRGNGRSRIHFDSGTSSTPIHFLI